MGRLSAVPFFGTLLSGGRNSQPKTTDSSNHTKNHLSVLETGMVFLESFMDHSSHNHTAEEEEAGQGRQMYYDPYSGGSNSGAFYNTNRMSGSFSGYGHQQCCCKKDDNGLLMLLAGAAAFFFINMLITMAAAAPRKRRRSLDTPEDPSISFTVMVSRVYDLIWARLEDFENKMDRLTTIEEEKALQDEDGWVGKLYKAYEEMGEKEEEEIKEFIQLERKAQQEEPQATLNTTAIPILTTQTAPTTVVPTLSRKRRDTKFPQGNMKAPSSNEIDQQQYWTKTCKTVYEECLVTSAPKNRSSAESLLNMVSGGAKSGIWSLFKNIYDVSQCAKLKDDCLKHENF